MKLIDLIELGSLHGKRPVRFNFGFALAMYAERMLVKFVTEPEMNVIRKSIIVLLESIEWYSEFFGIKYGRCRYSDGTFGAVNGRAGILPDSIIATVKKYRDGLDDKSELSVILLLQLRAGIEWACYMSEWEYPEESIGCPLLDGS